MARLASLCLKSPGMDRQPDQPLMRSQIFVSSGTRLLQFFLEISKEPASQGNCLIITGLARLSSFLRSSLQLLISLHMPMGGCADPSIWLSTGTRVFVLGRRRGLSYRTMSGFR